MSYVFLSKESFTSGMLLGQRIPVGGAALGFHRTVFLKSFFFYSDKARGWGITGAFWTWQDGGTSALY